MRASTLAQGWTAGVSGPPPSPIWSQSSFANVVSNVLSIRGSRSSFLDLRTPERVVADGARCLAQVRDRGVRRLRVARSRGRGQLSRLRLQVLRVPLELRPLLPDLGLRARCAGVQRAGREEGQDPCGRLDELFGIGADRLWLSGLGLSLIDFMAAPCSFMSFRRAAIVSEVLIGDWPI